MTYSTGLILMTVAILQFTIIPLIADLNSSHATNPQWPDHARFHVVTQLITTSGLGVVALYFLWSGRVDPQLGVCVAMALASTALFAFFASAATTSLYGGAVVAAAGIASIRLGRVDGNVANFGLASVLLLTGRLIV